MEVRLGSFRELHVAEMMEHLLQDHGLHPRPLNTSDIFLFGGGQWYDLWIPKEEDKIAREIIINAGYEDALSKK